MFELKPDDSEISAVSFRNTDVVNSDVRLYTTSILTMEKSPTFQRCLQSPSGMMTWCTAMYHINLDDIDAGYI
jgi:hypothetical protein